MSDVLGRDPLGPLRPGRLRQRRRGRGVAIDFDDAVLTEELRRPVDQRSIETVHAPSEAAREVFATWAATPGLTRY